MRFVFLALLLAITGPTALAVAAGGAQAPQPSTLASAVGGGLRAPSGDAAAPLPGPAPAMPPPATAGGGATAPTSAPPAPAPSLPETVATAPTDTEPGSPGSPGTRPEASEQAPVDTSGDTPSGPPEPEPELVDSRALTLGSVPAVARVLAPPADMASRARDVEVSAPPLLGVRDLAQREVGEGAQGRDRGGVDIEVPVDGAEPAPAPSPPVAAVGAQSLPRTGLELVALWAFGVLSLTGGFALLALARRLRPR